MKRPTMLLDRILLDGGLQVNLAVKRDSEVIQRRFEKEGMSFLTITLPSLCDALDQSLAQGRITPSMFNGFKPFKRGGKLPAIFAGFFMRIFHLDGSLLVAPCIDSIRIIRQVTRTFKKVELPCSSARISRAFERYKDNDKNVIGSSSIDDADLNDLRLVASYLWSDLEVLSGELYCFPGVFGSGATAERAKFNERNSIKCWPDRAEASFPSIYHTTYNLDNQTSTRDLTFISEGDEQPVRVVQVPKTLKTPRIISIEPSYMMLMQQSIAKPLMDYLESDRFLYNGSIRFTDQSVNVDKARVGSLDGRLATIDLSDASDLVSNDIVSEVFRTCPTFLSFISDCRSTKAKMPDGQILSLNKFSSMGSALCFPIESMVFLTIACLAMYRLTDMRLSRDLLKDITANIDVYGDDIIVPANAASGVCDLLETFGLKVNHDKTFQHGLFRESCGGDFFSGHDVTPSYCRFLDTSHHSGPSIREVVSLVSFSNQLYMKGFWHACQTIREYVELLTKRRFPRSTIECGVLTFRSCMFNTDLVYDKALSGYKTKGYKLSVRKQDDDITDMNGAMHYSFGNLYHHDSRESLRKGCSVNTLLPIKSSVNDNEDWDIYSRMYRKNRFLVGGKFDGKSQISRSIKMKNGWSPTNVGLSW